MKSIGNKRKNNLTLKRMRERIAEQIEIPAPLTLEEKDRYRFMRRAEFPPEFRTVPMPIRVTLQTYHRVAEVMARLECSRSDAVEAMLCDVEACKVQPVDKGWKRRYTRKSIWQSLDIQKVLKLRKKKHNAT